MPIYSHLRFITILFFLIFCSSNVHSQTNDSLVIHDLKSKIYQTDEDTARIRLYNEIATLYYNYDQDSMEAYARRAYQLSVKENHIEDLGYSLLNIGRSFYMRCQYDSTIHYYINSLGYFTECDNKVMQGSVLNRIGICYGTLGLYDSSLIYFTRAKILSKNIGDDKKYCEILHNIGIVYKHLGNWEKALEYFEESKEVTQTIYGREELTPYFYEISIIHKIRGDYLSALENCQKALEIAEEFNLLDEQAYVNDELGSIYLAINEYEHALKHFQKVLKYYNTTENKLDISLIYTNMGAVFEEQNKYDSALYFHTKALELQKEMNELRGIALSYFHIGKIFYTVNNYDKALNYLKQAAIIQKNQNIKNELADTYNQLSLLYKQISNHDLAFQYSQMAYNLGEELESIPIMCASSKTMSQYYERKGKYKEAFQYLKLNKQLSDSLLNDSRIKEITSLGLQYDFDKKQKEIEYERDQEKMMYNTDLKQQRWIRNSFILGFLVVLIVGVLLYRSYKIKKKSNEEKEALLKEIHHRVKNNLQMISSLLSLQTSIQKDSKVKEAVLESQNRVKSMALIHQLLYQEESLSKINMNDYIGQLLGFLSSTFAQPDKIIQLEQKIEHLKLDIETSVPLGLIVNELVSNAFKYAFKNTDNGKITVALIKDKSDMIHLVVKDNGTGLPDDFDYEKSNSLGMKLVSILAQQLRGELNITSGEGVTIHLSFKERIRS
ncbi:MAG: tetratricopeptide repeat protein [Bacteroidales bacterium]|nr:tetratricopeptide repeat protein [Bacteroidales bacterium]